MEQKKTNKQPWID